MSVSKTHNLNGLTYLMPTAGNLQNPTRDSICVQVGAVPQFVEQGWYRQATDVEITAILNAQAAGSGR